MIKTILIDDSQLAIDALAKKLELHHNHIQIIATFTNPLKAVKEIPGLNPDLIFLDIEMPEMDGFALLDKIQDIAPSVIFVTAYNHYAIQAIRASVFDYIEKPVDVQQLSATIKRFIDKEKAGNNQNINNQILKQLIESVHKLENQHQVQTISVVSKDSIDIVHLAEIVRLESMSNYTKFHLSDGRVLVSSKTMGEYEELLISSNFLRVHRSHIINALFMKKFHRNNENYVLMKDGSKIEVSDRRKKELLDFLTKI